MADAAILVLYNKDKKMLLQHRTAYKKRWANYWGSFGGTIDEGEAPEVAVVRELSEELAYKIQNPFLLFVQPLEADKKYIFIEEVDDTQTLVPNPEECQNMAWCTLEEALALNLIPHDVEVVQRVHEHLSSQE